MMKYLNINLDGYKVKCFSDYIGLKLSTGTYYEQSLLDVIKDKFQGGDIIDVGSNIGNHILFYNRHLHPNKIIGFEPAPEIYAVLNENVKQNNLDNVMVVNAGLGSENSFGVVSKYDENNFGATKIEKNLDGNLKIYSYDSIAETLLNSPIPKFIKIDVEGFESQVVSGMIKTIEKYKPMLLIEIIEENAEYIISTLLNMNYEITYVEGMNFLFEHRETNISSTSVAFLGEKLIKQTQSSWFYRNSMLELKDKIVKNETYLETLNALVKKMEDQNSKLSQEYSDLQENNNKLTLEIEKLKEKNEILRKKYDTFINSKSGALAYKIYSNKSMSKNLLKFKQKTYATLSSFKQKVLDQVGNRKGSSVKNDSLQSSSKENADYKSPKKINVAMLVDEFTYNSFKYEVNAITFEPNNWRVIFDAEKPDIFFCESAWSGVDSIKRPWKGRIYSSANFKKENRTELLNILEYCRHHGIKTVFWNKEDPTHYADKIHNFVDTACKFDYIFTTAEECVEGYRKLCGHDNVFSLPFATQPRLFNPIEKFDRTNEVIFAGSWYRQHEERSKVMENIFDTLLNKGLKLKIYNRHYGNVDLNHQFPTKYNAFIHKNLSYTQLDQAYKGSNFSLNINTVTESSTMFARRVFELMSSNTYVFSNYSVGIESLFGKYVTFVEKDEKQIDELINNPDEVNRRRYYALQNVLLNHTYKQRVRYVLNKIDYKFIEENEDLNVILVIKNVEDIELAIERFKGQVLANKLVTVVLDINQNLETLQNYIYDYSIKNINILLKKDLTEEKIKVLKGKYFSVFNYQLEYPTTYLRDMMLAYNYIEEDIIIKKSSETKDDYKYVQTETLEECIVPLKSSDLLVQYLNKGEIPSQDCFSLKIM